LRVNSVCRSSTSRFSAKPRLVGAGVLLFLGFLGAGRAWANGPSAAEPTATVKNGVQYVVTDFSGGRYLPFTVQAGLPVQWTVRIKASDLNGCNRALVVPAFGVQKRLRPGDNLIEFTPTKSGVVPYSCWMGMIRSRIDVVESLQAAKAGARP
jgi:uncharacterized protein